MNLPVARGRPAPTARPHTSLGQRPTAIKLRNSRSRSQAPAWERPCLGGSSLPFLSGALCFWRSGRRLEPPGILHSQAGAWERARVTRASKLNLMAVGQRPRSLGDRPLALKARSIPPEIWNALTALNALFFEVLGRCPRLVWSRAVGPERRRATTGSCSTINAALWPPARLRNYPKRFLHPSAVRAAAITAGRYTSHRQFPRERGNSSRGKHPNHNNSNECR